jgi:hypothetical protein
MNAVVMNMRGHTAGSGAGVPEEYGDEVMLSGWNPQVAAVEQSLVEMDRYVARLAGMANVDIDSFLQKMYE